MHYFAMKNMREKDQRESEDFEQQRQNTMAREVLGWLSAGEDNQEEFLHRLADIRQPETCNWILENNNVKAWLQDDHRVPILWINGMPGAGEPFIILTRYSSSLIRACRQKRSLLFDYTTFASTRDVHVGLLLLQSPIRQC